MLLVISISLSAASLLSQIIDRSHPQPGVSARLRIEVTRKNVRLHDKAGIVIALRNTTSDKSFYVTQEIHPLVGGFPFRDYFIEVKPPDGQGFLESVQGFSHGTADERITEDYWLAARAIVLLRPGKTHSATMDFTWEELFWFLNRENKLKSGPYALRAVYYAHRMPGEDNFRIPPLKESLLSNTVEIQLSVP